MLKARSCGLQFDSKPGEPERCRPPMTRAPAPSSRAALGSSVVTALVQAQHATTSAIRAKEILVLNHSSIDPRRLTGRACSWRQFEANTAMKMKAIANYVKKQPDIQKVYLLNQDYAHGKRWAHYGREMMVRP